MDAGEDIVIFEEEITPKNERIEILVGETLGVGRDNLDASSSCFQNHSFHKEENLVQENFSDNESVVSPVVSLNTHATFEKDTTSSSKPKSSMERGNNLSSPLSPNKMGRGLKYKRRNR